MSATAAPAELWVHIGSWPKNAPGPGLNRSVVHLWTGSFGAACGVEDYGQFARTDKPVRRCRACQESVANDA